MIPTVFSLSLGFAPSPQAAAQSLPAAAATPEARSETAPGPHATLRFSFEADGMRGRLGSTLANLGDQDGDGTDELALGAFGLERAAGRVTVVRPHDAAPLGCTSGVAAGELFGATLARLGDLDHDGVDEWLVGAPGAAPNGTNSGTVRVLSGRTGALVRELHGEARGDEFGAALAGASDVDQDGTPDLLIGAPGVSRKGWQMGRAALYSGATFEVLRLWGGDAGEDRFGSVVCGLGDVDGDHHGDVAIAAQQVLGPRTGYVRVYSGVDGLLIGRYGGKIPGDAFGSALASLGDVDPPDPGGEPGFGELAIGAFLASKKAPGAGAVTVISIGDGRVRWTFDGEAPGEQLGAALATLDDLDGDGANELAIGAPAAQRGAGRVYVVSGRSGARLFVIDGSRPYERFGAALASAHAFGEPRLAIGAPDHGARFALGGRVYVYGMNR
ncbi:MAG: integrin alpha [Planctomycetes bacterium]|nr:integrin alpha [Planctomycetota bacterium]